MQISQLVKPSGRCIYLVDTLALVKSLETQGIPSKHAEAITSAITEDLDDSLENISQNLISRTEMQQIEMKQEVSLSKFKSEIQSSQGNLKQSDSVECGYCVMRYMKEIVEYENP